MVGLLLLLGLFWYWASSLIGDDGDSPSTPTGQAIILTQDPPTATATVPVEITPEETGEPDDNGGSQPTPPTPTPTEEPESTGGRFEIGDIVAVTENNVRMRGGPSTSAEIIIESMSADTELRITGAPTQGDGFLWWPVEDEVSGDTGWVADDFLELS